jgi:negative regulator of sigma E activity
MSKKEFDALLVKRLCEEDLEYDRTGWERIARLLPTAAPVAAPARNEFDEALLKSIQDAELPYNPALWTSLASRLPATAGQVVTAHPSFDDSLIDKLREDDFEYNPAHWERLAQLLPTEQPRPAAARFRKRPLFLPRIAAAAALVLAAAFVTRYLVNDNSVEIPSKPDLTIASTTSEQKAGPAQKQPAQASQAGSINTTANAQPAANRLQYAALTGGSSAHVQVNRQLIPAEANENTNTPATADPFVVAETDIPVAHPATPDPVPVLAENLIAHSASVAATESPLTYTNASYPSAFYEGRRPGGYSNTSYVGVGGGMNYGNMNAGYALGISARTKLAGDFFVDGTVAMVYNNNAMNTGVNNGPTLKDQDFAGFAARPAEFKNTVPTPAMSPIQKLYYVQFNPSIGYQLEKHVAISVGGDFQRMLNREPEVVQQIDNNAKVLPSFDVGLTTKSEVSITPSIQAGLIYREGINNLFKSEGGRFVNRRYIQVQFKYTLPIQ